MRLQLMSSAAPVLIVGQGLAGTLVARVCERRGRAFVIIDAGHERAASRVGAGIINPITGRRLVRTAGIEADLPFALTAYRDWEALLGRPILAELKVRRRWVSADEREAARERLTKGLLAPYVDPAAFDDEGVLIAPAWRVDTAGLIAGARARWLAEGRLREATVSRDEVAGWAGPVVWCDGAGGRAHGLPLTVAAGALATLRAPELARDGILNRGGRWLMPSAAGGDEALVGAVYSANDYIDAEAARAELTAMAAGLTGGRAAGVDEVRTGLRMMGTDRRPLSGWFPGREGFEGCLNGLGSKGALWAPRLAEEWGDRLAGA
ncbi:MAG: hypothetical protein ABII82_16400 [Verrucomicrobiota bacterium]